MEHNFCHQCGTQLNPNINFCGSCGTSISSKTKTQKLNNQPGLRTYYFGALSKALLVFFIFEAILGLINAVAHFSRASYMNDLINGKRFSYSRADDLDNFVEASYGWLLIVHLIAFILLVIWAWRATKNLESWGASLKWSPGWAIGGGFIPIGFLWIPYQVVRDAWSLVPEKDHISENQHRNGAWLLSFISFWVSLFMMRFGAELLEDGLNTPTTDSLETIQTGDVLIGIGCLIITVFAISICVATRQISRLHNEYQS